MPFRRLKNLCRNILRKQRADHDLDREIHSYLDLLAEEKTRSGMTRDEALAQARRELGSVEQIKENVRDIRMGVSMDNLLQDVRYGLRVLKRNPGFAATAILTLALGIGATTAIFSVVDAIVFKPLPFPNAARLVRIRSVVAAAGAGGGVASYPDFLDLRARNHVFEGMAAVHTNDFTLIGPREPLHIPGAVVSAQLFSMLGVSPALGRSFLPAEDSPAAAGGANPVILSGGLWQRQFGSDPAVLGRGIHLGDQMFTVVGVMPPAFQYPIQAEPVELWTTIALDLRGGVNAVAAQRGAHYLDVAGVLKPGVEIRQAQSELAAIAANLNREHPDNKARTVRIVPEIQSLIGPIRDPLLVLLGAVGCVLLIVCVNVANLLLARATGRRKEMAVRAALGAGRLRAARQLFTESVSLGLLGGALGLALALASLRLLVRLIPAQVPRLDAIGLDGRVLAFAFLISLAAGILFGLAPALRVSRISLTASLRESGRGAGSGGREHNRVRNTLVVSEVALAVVLLLGSSLLLQSFRHLTQADPGFNRSHVLTFQLDSPAGRADAQIPAFYRDIVAQIGLLPGVQSSSAVASLPLTGENFLLSVEAEGQPTPMASRPSVDFNAIEPNYFRTLGIALAAGRDFTERDDSKSTPVVIVNRAFAARFFPSQNPIGKHVRPGIGGGAGEPPMREIVGVSGDVKQSDPGSAAAPEIYAPLAQVRLDPVYIVARTANDPRSIIAPARREVAALDRTAPIYHTETLDQYFAESVAAPRFVTLLLTGFAGLALLLASVGIYGVISYIAAQRTHEIGIRLALGARKGEILRMVIAKGLAPALAGLAIGVAAALRLTRLLSSLLYGVSPTDTVTFAAVSLILMGVALLACYIPARRAAKTDPMISLRYE
ncbi:MAG: ABC transporter permease [Bryobacteraceae bacterium]